MSARNRCVWCNELIPKEHVLCAPCHEKWMEVHKRVRQELLDARKEVLTTQAG